MMRSAQSNNYKNTAPASYTSTASVSDESVTATFPGNSTAIPRRIRVSGNVSGYVQLQVSQNRYIAVPVNPNAAYTEEMIPTTAFSGPVTAVALSVTLNAAGSVNILVDGV
jgi:hypothetical protein